AAHEMVEGLAPRVHGLIHEIREHRGKLREAFERGLRARKLLVREGKAAVVVVDRHHAAIEMSAFDRALRAALALERQRIDVLASDALERRDDVRADALVRLRM